MKAEVDAQQWHKISKETVEYGAVTLLVITSMCRDKCTNWRVSNVAHSSQHTGRPDNPATTTLHLYSIHFVAKYYFKSTDDQASCIHYWIDSYYDPVLRTLHWVSSIWIRLLKSCSTNARLKQWAVAKSQRCKNTARMQYNKTLTTLVPQSCYEFSITWRWCKQLSGWEISSKNFLSASVRRCLSDSSLRHPRAVMYGRARG